MILFKKGILAALLLSLAACQVSKPLPDSSGKKKILSTIAQIGDLVSEIGGDRIDSQILVRGELNPHVYELVKGDDEKINQSEIIFYNGLGLEHGASVSAMLQAHPNAVPLGEIIQQNNPDKILWKGKQADPHIWMDISLWSQNIDTIAENLTEIDPAGAADFHMRASVLKEKMIAADQRIYGVLQKIPSDRRFLVTSHDAFHYFTRAYLAEPGETDWEKRFAAPEGLAPDGQLNPIDLQKIIDHLHRYHIEALFPESNVSRDSIRKIADAGKQMGLKLRICRESLYGDAFRGTYLESMDHNAETIAKMLESAHE